MIYNNYYYFRINLTIINLYEINKVQNNGKIIYKILNITN